MPEPYELSVVEAAARVRDGSLSPVALAESLLARIDAFDSDLQAWVTIDRDGVLAAAREREAEVASGGPLGPIHGVPVGLKDIFYTAGMLTACGSRVYADFVPDFDATSVAKIKAAGGIDPRQGSDHRVRHLRPVADPQSVEPRPHARRLQQRLIGGRGGPDGARPPSARRPAAPRAVRPPTTASSASSPPTAASAATAWCR